VLATGLCKASAHNPRPFTEGDADAQQAAVLGRSRLQGRLGRAQLDENPFDVFNEGAARTGQRYALAGPLQQG